MPTTASWPSAQRRRSTSRDGGRPLIARRSVGTLWRWLIGAAIDIVAMVEGRTAAGGVTGRDPHASLRQQLDRLVEPLVSSIFSPEGSSKRITTVPSKIGRAHV